VSGGVRVRFPRRRASLRHAALLVVLVVLCSAALEGQERGPSETFPIPFAYASGGTEYFSIGGATNRVLRLPFTYSAREQEGARWGVKIRFPFSIGFHDVKLEEGTDLELRSSIETVAFTPGVELEIPLREAWRLSPYAELGVGTGSVGSLESLLYEVGVRSLWVLPRDSHQVRIGAALTYEGFRFLNGDLEDAYGLAEVGLEFRSLGLFELGEQEADPGVYVMIRRYLPEIELVPLRQEPITASRQYEVGLTGGLRPGKKIWGRKLPRVGLAYRWGQGLTSIRLNFGFPF
jgi:hypothetical protein